jgi:ubiquinone/menaquinone biosynthesis C-methylase UbiE
MVDSPFFGSPTKLFEYMAMAGGIVASDLEQIGEVLQPALRVAELSSRRVDEQVAILCKPGDVEEFLAAVVALARDPALCSALGANARRALIERFSWSRHVERLFSAASKAPPIQVVSDISVTSPAQRLRSANGPIETGDAYKNEAQHQWDNDPAGSHYVKTAMKHTLGWYLEAEAYRYQQYAPWMLETMEFARHAGEDVLEVGGGMGTDLAQFAKHGARVTDVDLSAGHLELAEENFRLRGLQARFVHHDAESLPFPDASFDLVYSNGVLHHTPHTPRAVNEIQRVLRPGGRAIVMVYAEGSLNFWRIVLGLGLWHGMLADYSIGEIMSRTVELSTASGARPLVKVYTKRRLKRMFRQFASVAVVRRQLTPGEVPRPLRFLSADLVGRMIGWNLVAKATKSA